MQGTPSDYIVSTLGSCLSIWVLEPVLLYMALVLTKSDLVSNPALFCWANLFGNLISWTIPVGEPRIANMLAVSLASVLKLVMRSLPYDLPEVRLSGLPEVKLLPFILQTNECEYCISTGTI